MWINTLTLYQLTKQARAEYIIISTTIVEFGTAVLMLVVAVVKLEFLSFFFFFLLYRILLFSVKPQHESAVGLHISSPFETPSPLSPHPTPLGWCRAPVWVSWDIQQIPVGYLFYTWWCKFPCYSFHTSHPLLPSPHVHKSILYVSFCIAAL